VSGGENMDYVKKKNVKSEEEKVLEEYDKQAKMAIESLLKIKPTDRLDAAGHIASMISPLQDAVTGWRKHFGNPAFMKLLNEKTLNTIFNEIRNVAVKIVEADKVIYREVNIIDKKDLDTVDKEVTDMAEEFFHSQEENKKRYGMYS
tara:strand:+ start:48 stop:488 length:441 start_codon:yes stop_codon:yes gene_type:complete